MGVRRQAILIMAALVVCISAVAWFHRKPPAAKPRPPEPVPAAELAQRTVAPPAPAPAPTPPPTPEPAAPTPPESHTRADETAARANLDAARAAGIRTGLAAFNPPGTRPLKRGLVVPDGYQLPPGYARHFQVTDDGKQLRPILMYRPDFTPTNAAGEPIAVPADRIVPPENAPPGMPVEMLELPR